ncbi:molybdenum cofactor guanylyltransferase [Marivirga sp.]|uniref:molybdenum cofactor guanylyltransferase n=1 Tax=Marivirga sp. TaxID=2018662 RepID=UPI002D7F0898|nr:molybdenum cofactor guanylyltransferase [Marivirga sp.]HET8860931.1 molybdenum cofactor guanylyltransferase [Marivirga sp.]
MTIQPEIEIFLLAGGKSSRMGEDKGLASLAGKSILHYTLETLRLLDIPITIIAHDSRYEKFVEKVIPDTIRDKGPMGGLHTVFLNSSADYVLLQSCDMPFVPVEAYYMLMDQAGGHEVIVAEIDGRINPLLALYHKFLRTKVESNIKNDKLKMLDLIANSHSKVVNLDKLKTQNILAFANINTKEELEKIAKLLK